MNIKFHWYLIFNLMHPVSMILGQVGANCLSIKLDQSLNLNTCLLLYRFCIWSSNSRKSTENNTWQFERSKFDWKAHRLSEATWRRWRSVARRLRCWSWTMGTKSRRTTLASQYHQSRCYIQWQCGIDTLRWFKDGMSSRRVRQWWYRAK